MFNGTMTIPYKGLNVTVDMLYELYKNKKIYAKIDNGEIKGFGAEEGNDDSQTERI